jgi:hypothetical protein
VRNALQLIVTGSNGYHRAHPGAQRAAAGGREGAPAHGAVDWLAADVRGRIGQV